MCPYASLIRIGKLGKSVVKLRRKYAGPWSLFSAPKLFGDLNTPLRSDRVRSDFRGGRAGLPQPRAGRAEAACQIRWV